MFRKLIYITIIGLCTSFAAFGQDLRTNINENKALDSLRKLEANKKDSVVFNSKYIRFTTINLSKDSIQTFSLDTSLTNFQNYNLLHQPRRPTSGLGNLGLAARSLLFENNKNIGFQSGYNSLEWYTLNHTDLLFYKARTPFSSLYYVSGGEAEQIFKIILSQNINKNWNFGFNYNRIGANGTYDKQRGDDLGASVFSWYQSPNKRYNLFASAVFNTLKAAENGSLKNDTIFDGNSLVIDRKAEVVNLRTAKQLWRKNSISLRNTYFIGRIDSSKNVNSNTVLPTNSINFNVVYTKHAYSFSKDELDDFSVLPISVSDLGFNPDLQGYTKDTTTINHLSNEFLYGFYLRPSKSGSLKNEIKINAGIKYDLYQYQQASKFRDNSDIFLKEFNFQNISVLGSLGYKFSNKVDLNLNLNQVIQGRDFGNFLYEANSNVFINDKIGALKLSAYFQNKSPEYLFTSFYGNHRRWRQDFEKSKVLNLNAAYENLKYGVDLSASYYLLSKYLYYGTNLSGQVLPMQHKDDIGILRLSAGKKIKFGKFKSEHFGVYQEIDNETIIRSPKLYLYNSLAFNQTFFKVLNTEIGVDVRYNSSYYAQSYAPDISQFYNGQLIKFGTKPILGAWVKASLRRANLFVKYDYLDQGLFNLGYYTTNYYPMGDRLLKFGIQWNFYD